MAIFHELFVFFIAFLIWSVLLFLEISGLRVRGRCSTVSTENTLGVRHSGYTCTGMSGPFLPVREMVRCREAWMLFLLIGRPFPSVSCPSIWWKSSVTSTARYPGLFASWRMLCLFTSHIFFSCSASYEEHIARPFADKKGNHVRKNGGRGRNFTAGELKGNLSQS